MARKHQEVVITDEPEVITLSDSEPLFESEAYGTPQPEAGSDVTVMKQVGIGGPVPIVAPKHNTIQLQPIVVPLAVVPYMTQDSNILRTDTRQNGVYEGGDDGYREAAEFDTVEHEKKAKRKHKISLPRIASLVAFLLTALMIIPFFVSYKTSSIGVMNIAEFDTISHFKWWIDNGFTLDADRAIWLVYIIVMCLVGIQAIFSAVGLLIGKYPKPTVPILSFLSSGALIGVMVYKIVKHKFIANDEVGLLVLLVLGLLTFIGSVIISVVINHNEDKAEQKSRRGAEI